MRERKEGVHDEGGTRFGGQDLDDKTPRRQSAATYNSLSGKGLGRNREGERI
jgi:hypothetical protein